MRYYVKTEGLQPSTYPPQHRKSSPTEPKNCLLNFWQKHPNEIPLGVMDCNGVKVILN